MSHAVESPLERPSHVVLGRGAPRAPATPPHPPAARWRSLAAGLGGGLALLVAGGLWAVTLLVAAWNAVAGKWVGGASEVDLLGLLVAASVASAAGLGLALRARRLALRGRA